MIRAPWNRSHILCRLLEHGPLTYSELRQITGWHKKRLDRGLEVVDGNRVRCERGRYRLETDDERELRRLRDCQRWESASTGMGPLQPGMRRVRRQSDLFRSPYEDGRLRSAQQAHDGDRRGVGEVRAQRGAAARAGHPRLEGLGGVGA